MSFLLRVAAIAFLVNGPYEIPFEMHLNYTDHEKYIAEEIKAFSKFEWFRQQKGSFGKYYSAPFAEILMVRGLGFTFNIMDSEEMLNL